jgi:hypothetical protein
MDGRAILTTKNIIMNFLNTQIAEVVFRWKHIFFLVDSVETRDN